MLWAPQIGKQFRSLLKYYQEMLSIMAPPIVAAFLLGIFWKRANATGAFVGLLAGIGLGVFNLVIKIKTGGSLFGEMHFLLTVPFYLGWSLLVMVVASLCTAPPPAAKIDGYTWSLAEYRAETAELKQRPLLDNYRFWSMLLLALCLITLIVFW
jgi:SSS family solute:Na+ symporter